MITASGRTASQTCPNASPSMSSPATLQLKCTAQPHRRDGALHVRGAPAVEEVAVGFPAKRPVAPARLVAWRDDIQVTVQDDAPRSPAGDGPDEVSHIVDPDLVVVEIAHHSPQE